MPTTAVATDWYDIEDFYVAMENNLAAYNHCADGQRRGQYLMNRLHDVRPDLYARVTGTMSDPFYRDDVIPAFWAMLEKEWDR